MIRDQALEKMDYIPDDLTQLNLNIFGEKLPERDIDDVMNTPESDWTIEDKKIIEKWEKQQDWDKVKELSDRGESFDDIQKAIDKGLLLKQDAIRRQGLIERGLAAIRPETRLESNLLGSLKKTFDPRSMIGSMAKSAAMKKLGLSWLNPLMGLASLFGLPQKARSMIASRKAPAFDPKKASQLGLYADRQPTDTIRQARVGEGTIGSDIALGKKGVFESGQELLGLKDIKEHRAEVTRPQYNTLKTLGQVGNVGGSAEEVKGLVPEGTFDSIEPSEWDQIFSGAKYKDIKQVAQGGRIDKPLIGRSRYI